MERERGDEALCAVGGGHAFFAWYMQHKDAEDGDLRQNTMPRRLWAHPARQRKKGSSHSGRGRGRRKITHPSVCIESDKVQIPQGSRCDASE